MRAELRISSRKGRCRTVEQDDSERLPVAAEGEGVVPLPGRPAGSVVVTVALAETTVLQDVLTKPKYKI